MKNWTTRKHSLMAGRVVLINPNGVFMSDLPLDVRGQLVR